MTDWNSGWRAAVPRPVCGDHPDFLRLYDFAWECAHEHVKDIPGMPCTPYMDEAFCPEFIWIWDTCFMSLFCKYAQSEFPGYESLNNFYEPLHGTAKLPFITSENPPEWTEYRPGQRVRLKLNIGDNPPLFAWAEYENALFHGSREHLRTLLLKKQYLQKHFFWLENLRDPAPPEAVYAPLFWRKVLHGYHWEGGRSGMDNSPRGRVGEHALVNRPNNPALLWVDAISQQALSARCIAEMAELIGESALAAEWRARFAEIRTVVNRYYWNDEKGCYFDALSTGGQSEVLTIASFWPLLAGIASPEQAARAAAALTDPEKLGGVVPAVSLSRDDPDFNHENGMYWRGSLWLPTAYMAVKAVERCGMTELARDLSVRIVAHMLRTFDEYAPHTIWECYHPERPEPARSCDENHRIVRPDFCGWSALGPIALLIENVIGIRKVDAFKSEVVWDLPEHEGPLGVERLTFGGSRVDLLAENGVVRVRAERPFALVLNGESLSVAAGETVFRTAEARKNR